MCKYIFFIDRFNNIPVNCRPVQSVWKHVTVYSTI